jgi:hypothetical protein
MPAGRAARRAREIGWMGDVSLGAGRVAPCRKAYGLSSEETVSRETPNHVGGTALHGVAG